MLTTPARQPRLDADFGEGERGQRRVFGGLQHDRIARRERRGDLPGQHEKREVPRDDLPADADRARSREFGVDQRGPAGVMVEVAGDQGNVDVARFADRLAVVDRLEHGKEALALLHVAGERVEMTRTLVAGERRPFRQRLARRRDRRVDVGVRALRRAGDPLAGRRVEHVEQRAGLGEPPVDEMAEARRMLREPGPDVLAAFRRRAIVHGAQDVLDQRHRLSLTPSRGDRPRNSGRSRNARAGARCRSRARSRRCGRGRAASTPGRAPPSSE